MSQTVQENSQQYLPSLPIQGIADTFYPSVGWPGLKWLPQRDTKDTFEMSTLYYMVQSLYEPYVSCSQVLSRATGLLILQENATKVLDWQVTKTDKSSVF